MPTHTSRVGRSLHNFSREQPSSPPTRTINRSKRFIRKYRKSKNNFEKLDKERVAEQSDKSGKDIYNNSGVYDIANTAVPDPVPDTGLGTAKSKLASTHHTILPAVTSYVAPTASPVSSFEPLPALLSVTTTPTTSVSSHIPSLSNLSQTQEHQPSAQPHHLPAIIITLLAVGSAFFFVGIFIVVKACSRPKRRARFTPSLPILDDDRFEPKVSPIFGGKERYSPRPGSNGGLYTWTLYPQLGKPIAKPTRAVGYGTTMDSQPISDAAPGTGGKTPEAMTSYDTSVNEKNEYQFAGHGAPSQQVQSTVTRMASRLSTASLSIYPSSPHDAQVGVATEGVPPFTADGYPVIKRTKSKTALQKSREADIESSYARYSQGLAYDGADVTSPMVTNQVQAHMLSNVPSAANGGRSRIKSTYYAPGAYPRMSVVPVAASSSTKTNYGNENPFESQHILRKSDSRRERDTRALTSALGLPSPIVSSSPQPTIYPSDSLSIVGDFYTLKPMGNGHGHDEKKITLKSTDPGTATQPVSVTVTDGDTSAALGNLMLMDFLPTSKSLAALSTVFPGEEAVPVSASLGLVKSVSKKSFRSDDKPPRVPSPPPMPSLTQMGLEHRNPEAYASYRSPTYSIYGLYESDRKN